MSYYVTAPCTKCDTKGCAACHGRGWVYILKSPAGAWAFHR